MPNRTVSTIRDVAREAKVSVATVSHVFNQTRRVMPETRELVLETARRLNYRPSGVARSLSTHRTNLVGVVVADVLNPYFSMIIRGVEDRLWKHGYSLSVCSTDESVDKEQHYLNLMVERRVDALIVAPTGFPQPIYEEIIRHQISLVFVDRRPPGPFGPVVEIDNFLAGRMACAYLASLGHQRIALMTRNPVLSTVKERTRGYLQGLADYQIQVDPTLTCVIESTIDAAEECTRRLLQQENPPTAIIGTNHVITLGVMTGLQKAGKRIPDDISLVGFDDNPWVSVFNPPLTVIRHPIQEICDATVNTLLSMLSAQRQSQTISPPAGDMAAEMYADIELTPELIIRQSCRAWHKTELVRSQ